jgi:uncharacterized protein (TIGR00730 family)
MNICVFCSSSNDLASIYYDEAQQIGTYIGEKGHTLVYGASNQGMMERMAKATSEANGSIIGIIPEVLKNKGFASKYPSELFVVESLTERKDMMAEYADVFVALPGSFGTLDEIFEVLGTAQLGYHSKPIIIVNSNDYYSPLIAQINNAFSGNFAHSSNKNLFLFVNNVQELIQHFEKINF